MRKFFAPIALVAGLCLSSAALAADLTNPGSQVEILTVENLTALLQELGAQEIKSSDVNNTKIIAFKSGSIPFNFAIGCDEKPGSCVALYMFVGIDPGTTHYPLEAFNAFNKNHPFVSAVQLDGNKFLIGRMLLTDGGITKKNLAVNVATFALAPDIALKYLSSQLVASYQQGPATLALQSAAPALAPRYILFTAPEALEIGQNAMRFRERR